MTRNKKLYSLRPQIAGLKETTSKIEYFQNETLRPILKFQHDLIVLFASSYLAALDKSGKQYQPSEKLMLFQSLFVKDNRFKHLLIGQIIALFTTEELAFYFEETTAINKRIIAMAKERFLSTLNT